MCNQQAYREGRRIICQECDAVYEVGKVGPVLQGQGVITGMQADIEAIKAKIGLTEGGQPEDVIPEAEPGQPEPQDDSDPANW